MPTSSETKSPAPTFPRLSSRAWWWIGGSVGVVVLGIVSVATAAYLSIGTNIVRGVTVANQPVGGSDTLTATHRLEDRWATFQQQAFQFQAPGRSMTILVTADSASEEEVVLGVVDFNPTTSVNAALSFGRRGSFWQRLRERTSGFFGRQHELGTVNVDSAALGTILQDKFGDLEQLPKNASLKFGTNDIPDITPGVDGKTFDYLTAVKRATTQAHQLDGRPIMVSATTAKPEIATSPALTTLAQSGVTPLLDRAPLTLNHGDTSWTISRDKLKTLLGFAGTTANPRLGFDTVATGEYLATIAKDVEVKAQNAKFSVIDGKVQAFQASAVGITLDTTATITAMQTALIDQQQPSVAIIVSEEQPLTDTVGQNDLGITELVGTATTNFKGSPTNRRFNLGYGAKLLNGLLIQPGEEFSLVKALGKIDGAHGWKPELVIKGSKITPEFGGGLCQVATTLFRTALNTGLPIVERHNHSLRISYYEPPVGLDATIYEPKPDLRFTNDYTTALLLQSAVEGTTLTFSFYGTKDGRTVDIPTPKVYNKVGIPATKNIEVDDLKPGQKVCQTPGHPGADATATYTVTKADGTKVTQTFQSHYRAIGVICRVGKKAAAKPTTPTTTNTNTAIPVTNVNVAVPVDTNTGSDTTITNQ